MASSHERRGLQGTLVGLKNVAEQVIARLAYSNMAVRVAAVMGGFFGPTNPARTLLELQAHTSAQVEEAAARVEA